MTAYAIPAGPTKPQGAAATAMDPQGARRTADKNNTALKWTIVGVANAAPASAARTTGLSAMSAMTTNCNPIKAPAAEPTITAVVGTPQYFAMHPAPATPHDLRKHRCINFWLPTAGTIYKWEFEQGHRKMEVGVDGPLVFDDEEMVVDAALTGVGLAYVIEDQVASLIQAGALARVLEDWCPPFPGFFLYYPGRRQASPALAAFIDAIRVPPKARKGR